MNWGMLLALMLLTPVPWLPAVTLLLAAVEPLMPAVLLLVAVPLLILVAKVTVEVHGPELAALELLVIGLAVLELMFV